MDFWQLIGLGAFSLWIFRFKSAQQAHRTLCITQPTVSLLARNTLKRENHVIHLNLCCGPRRHDLRCRRGAPPPRGLGADGNRIAVPERRRPRQCVPASRRQVRHSSLDDSVLCRQKDACHIRVLFDLHSPKEQQVASNARSDTSICLAFPPGPWSSSEAPRSTIWKPVRLKICARRPSPGSWPISLRTGYVRSTHSIYLHCTAHLHCTCHSHCS